MLYFRQLWTLTYKLIVLSVFLAGCAGRHYMLVDYQVPVATQELKGLTIRLKIADKREVQTFLTPTAATQFPDFSQIYSLAWITPEQERVLAGEHKLEALFKATFKKRLTDHGIGTTDDMTAPVPQLTIRIKQFTLDYKNRKWVADLGYDAVLSQPGHPTAKESVRGGAERVQIIGRKGADTIISELYSDVVNRLDLSKLFQAAKVCPNKDI